MALVDAFRAIWGGWFGDVEPARPPQQLPARDAREHALRALADFMAALEYQSPEATAPFTIPRANVFTHQPADPAQLPFPAVAFIPVRGRHDQFRLGPPPFDEASRDVYGQGTVLLELGEYVETFTVEVWGNHDGVRTSVLAGLESALRRGERSSALLLELGAYYHRVARFTLEESEHVDDPDVVRGRVRAHLFVRLEVPEVQLVDAVTLQPRFVANVVADP